MSMSMSLSAHDSFYDISLSFAPELYFPVNHSTPPTPIHSPFILFILASCHIQSSYLMLRRIVAVVVVLLVTYTVVHTNPHPRKPLRLAHINFLHTTDTHGWLGGHRNQPSYDADWGDFLAFSHHMKHLAHANHQDLLLVDLGDRHDGNGLSDATAPPALASNPIFAAQHYDIITLGNHELYQWENTAQELELLVPHYGHNYVCLNVEALVNGLYVPIGHKFRYFVTPMQKIRVLSFAFLFDFPRANQKTRVTAIENAVSEKWFLDVLDSYSPDDIDLVVVVGHMPVSRRWAELLVLHRALRLRYPTTIIQYFGGHSHIRDFLVMDEFLTGLQSGRFAETLGFLSVDLSPHLALRDRFFRAYLDFSTSSFGFHAGTHALTLVGARVKQQLRDLRKNLGLDSVLGHVATSYYMDYVPLSHPHNIYTMLTEKVLPLLVPRNTSSVSLGQRIIIINTGSVRYDLYKGPYTLDTHYIISPFQNDWVKMKLPKSIAVRLEGKLNENAYIVLEDGRSTSLLFLRPPHAARSYNTADVLASNGDKCVDFDAWEYASPLDELAEHRDWPFSMVPPVLSATRVFLDSALFQRSRLSKGYVTHDDFGSDGDDTPHKGVVHYPIPNVVLSQQLVLEDDSPVDVVFYTFLIPSVTWAIKELGGEVPEWSFYSDNYLGLLLSQYVASNQL